MSFPRSVTAIMLVSVIVVLAVFSAPVLIDGIGVTEEVQTTTVDIRGEDTAEIGGTPLTLEVVGTSPTEIQVTDTVTGEQAIAEINESETIDFSDSFEGGSLNVTYDEKDGNVRTFTVEHSQPWDFDEGTFEEHTDEITTVFMLMIVVTVSMIAARVVIQ